MFEDEKISYIESLPDADSILIIWIKLLTLTGKCNAGGYVMLTENIPYSDEMLAHRFKRPLNTIKFALETFIRLNMIELTETGFYISNWEKHQSIDKLETIREQNRIRKQRQREKEKLLLEDVTGQSHSNHAIELDLDLDKDKEKDLKKNVRTKSSPPDPNVKEFIDYYFDRFLSLFGEKPVINGGKDGAIIKSLLNTYGLEKLKGLLDDFFKISDSYVVERGFTIGTFKTQINRLLISKKVVGLNGGTPKNRGNPQDGINSIAKYAKRETEI